MHTPRLARQLIATSLIAVGTLAMVPAHSVQSVQANSISGPGSQGFCQRVVINPRRSKLLCKLVIIFNELRHLPIIVTLLSDGFLEFQGTNTNQRTGQVDAVVVDHHYVLVRINKDGSFTIVDGKDLKVNLDGKPQYAVVPRLSLRYSATSAGHPLTVGEGTFENVPKRITITVAVGGRITFSSTLNRSVEVKPLDGFILQIQKTVKVNGKKTTVWETAPHNIIPPGAVARFAAVPDRR